MKLSELFNLPIRTEISSRRAGSPIAVVLESQPTGMIRIDFLELLEKVFLKQTLLYQIELTMSIDSRLMISTAGRMWLLCSVSRGVT